MTDSKLETSTTQYTLELKKMIEADCFYENYMIRLLFYATFGHDFINTLRY